MKRFVLSLLILCLAATLCACGPVSGPAEESAGPSETPSPSTAAPTDTPESPEPKEYSFSDIEGILRSTFDRDELMLVEVRDAGKYTVIQYTVAGYPNEPYMSTKFAWFDRETGTVTEIPFYMDTYARFDLDESSGRLTAQTIGWNDLYYIFPHLSLASAGQPDTENWLPYYRPVGEESRLGPWQSETSLPQKLLGLHCEDEGIWLIICPDGWTPSNSFVLPRMEIHNEDGVATITLLDVTLGQDFLLPDDPRVLSVTASETGLTIRLEIGEAVRYCVGKTPEGEEAPAHDETAFALPFHYVGADFVVEYPEGW